VGGRLSTGSSKKYPVVRQVRVGGRSSTSWLNLSPIMRCLSEGKFIYWLVEFIASCEVLECEGKFIY
jgi:hypothetical protein